MVMIVVHRSFRIMRCKDDKDNKMQHLRTSHIVGGIVIEFQSTQSCGKIQWENPTEKCAAHGVVSVFLLFSYLFFFLRFIFLGSRFFTCIHFSSFTMTVHGQTVFITGASSGIGLACAEVFAEAGARLLLAARRTERLTEIASRLASQYGTESHCIVLDVRDRAAVQTRLGEIPAAWQTIDVLINNAGLSRGLDTVQEGNLDDWDAMIDTNVKGLLYVSRAVLPRMVARKQGMVINMGSIAGREVYPKGNVYCATKHAVRALSQAMYRDTNGANVRVCNIDPGMVETEFSEVRFNGDKERAKAVYNGMKPLTARDIADVALFCATRPPHVTLHDIQIMPTSQASATLVHRE
jgi:3-hydroxy acid dehydrogenase / malonic semialdehyde reductase